jgi:hypothetical protein
MIKDYKTTCKDRDASRREEALRNQSNLEDQYKSQYCDNADGQVSRLNNFLDMLNMEGVQKIAPMYKSGINPNFYEEYFLDLESSDLTNTNECRAIIWNEYERRRWSYCTHLSGYTKGSTQKINREVTTVELWRRLGLRQPSSSVIRWYLDKERQIGDIIHRESGQYTEGVSIINANFANCPIPPKQTLTFGSVHVAVGFVDLGILLDSHFAKAENKSQSSQTLLLRGIEANPFSVAKSLVLWDLMSTTGTKPSWVVQVWFSSVWSKCATKAFLAAARRLANFECGKCPSNYHPEVISLIHHWACSKGVGLKKLIKRRSKISKESSDALFFATKEDRIEMIRYYLTGSFGLFDEDPCSSSITMFDCPKAPHKVDAASVFQTLTIHDVVSSSHFNGSYFQTAEKVKESRVSALMEYIQEGRIEINLSVHKLSLNSNSVPVMEEIASLQPMSISWSNILDYIPRNDFHTLARKCSASAIHSGYSMNWPTITYGASLIDYPETSLHVIEEAEKATIDSMREVCGDREIFLLPIQHNPLNITHSFLANRCYSHWLHHFFNQDNIHLIQSGMMEDTMGNPLSYCNGGVVSCMWTYT